MLRFAFPSQGAEAALHRTTQPQSYLVEVVRTKEKEFKEQARLVQQLQQELVQLQEATNRAESRREQAEVHPCCSMVKGIEIVDSRDAFVLCLLCSPSTFLSLSLRVLSPQADLKNVMHQRLEIEAMYQALATRAATAVNQVSGPRSLCSFPGVSTVFPACLHAAYMRGFLLYRRRLSLPLPLLIGK